MVHTGETAPGGAKKNKTIRAQIFIGYINMTVVMAVLVIISLVYLYVIRGYYLELSRYQMDEVHTQQAGMAHYQWQADLNTSILTGSDFTGSLNPDTCSLGVWAAGAKREGSLDSQVQSALDAAHAPHQEIHQLAEQLLERRKTDAEGAYDQYLTVIKPKSDTVIKDLEKISVRYGELSADAAHSLENFINISIITGVVFAAAGIALALVLARKISHGISKPITAVAEWSRKLSLGAEDLSFEAIDTEENRGNEIGMMIASFRKMAQSISDNVNVVRRVADGDMTAFVNIRSQEDALGRNLYRMVQSNDLLFANIIEIAQTVADGSEGIARASHSLAESAGVQAQAVHGLSATVDEAGQLTRRNAEKTEQAVVITDEINRDVEESNGQMKRLAKAVEDIRAASEQISAVIKSIDGIAFQTNILALNASIEAARAGTAGKGFAVVADEVRELALKSAQAAEETKALIENTITKTNDGSLIAGKALDMFGRINQDVAQIVSLIGEIAAASEGQLKGIDRVREEISAISMTASGNAALSVESDAASRDMHENADQLKAAMGRFNLRKRQSGHAYIPPEKADDADFIRRAEENYQRAQETGNYGRAYIDSQK